MEASQEITGNAAATTGLTTLPFSNEIGALSKRREALIDRSGKSLADQEGVQKQVEDLIGQRGTELAKPRQDLIDRSKDAPSLDAHEETVKDFQRPQMDPREFKEIFGILMASSMLFGAASRQPWYAAMGAIEGSMKGFMQADGEYVKEQMAVYTKNVEAIKTRNEQKRHDVDTAWKKYSNDLDQLRREYELIAAKYDDPLALLASRSKSIVEAQKLIDNNIKSIDGAVDKLLVAGATQTANAARLEEARARREEASARFQESFAFRQQQEAARATARDEKQTRERFKDVQSLRKEYNADVKPLVGDLGKVDRILAYADNPGAFSDNQLRQAVTEFQKGARGTNAMVASLMNFGTLDERVAGTFNRFFEGEYTPTQRQDVKELFTMLKSQVLQPGLEERKTRYRWLASQNRLDPDQVVAGEEAPPAQAPAAPASGGAPPAGFGKVVPRSGGAADKRSSAERILDWIVPSAMAADVLPKGVEPSRPDWLKAFNLRQQINQGASAQVVNKIFGQFTKEQKAAVQAIDHILNLKEEDEEMYNERWRRRPADYGGAVNPPFEAPER